MSENPVGVRIVEIRAGESQRPVLELRPGEAVQPMSIGRVGMWPIEAPGVLDVHAYVYFDGRVLFLQSADPTNPAKGNGQAVGVTWQQIEMPCTIEMGRARLVYRTLEDEEADEDKTIAQPIQVPLGPPMQFRAGAGAFSNRNQPPDDEATRLAPIPRDPDPTIVSPLEMGATPHGGAPQAQVPKARPAAGMPAHEPMPISATTVGPAPAPPPPQTGYQAFGTVQVAVPAPPQPPPPGMMMQPMMQQQPGMMQQQGMIQHQMMAGYVPPGTMPMGSGGYPQQPPNPTDTSRLQTGELTGLAKARAEWAAMPPLRKFILGTFPAVALLVYMMLFDEPPQPQPGRRPAPSSSVGDAGLKVAETDAAPPASVTTPPINSTPPVVTNTIPTTTGPVMSGTSLPGKGKRTLEREAIDYAASGQYTKAAELYDQLAAQHPEQPAYKEAARLLRQRLQNPN